MKMLICINDRVYKWPHTLRRGAVYTEVERYRHCSKAKEFVRIAETEVGCPKKQFKCVCGELTDYKMAGMFWSGRFRPMLPPKSLGVTIEQVRKLYNSQRVKEKS